jgi:hypothetical protein
MMHSGKYGSSGSGSGLADMLSKIILKGLIIVNQPHSLIFCELFLPGFDVWMVNAKLAVHCHNQTAQGPLSRLACNESNLKLFLGGKVLYQEAFIFPR